MPTNPKILQANNYFYVRGGSERYLFCLMDLLSDRGCETVPFSTKNKFNPPSEFAQYFADEFDPDTLPSLPFTKQLGVAGRMIYSIGAKKKALKLVEKTRPDLAHCHNIYGALSPSILDAFKKKGLPVVMTVHDVKMLCPNHRMFVKHAACERCKLYRFYQCAINKCIGNSFFASLLACVELYVHRALDIYDRNVDVFICPSEFYRKKLAEYGISEDKVVRIPNFIDVDNYHPNFDGGRYAIYFGRLEEAKGVEILINAAEKLGGAMDFVIAGAGPLENKLRRKIEENKIGNVKLVGSKEGKELIDLIRNSMFSVVPSVWYENNPYSVLESYACGKAVIGSGIGGIPEIIEEGRTGLTFLPSDVDDLVQKIKLLVCDPKLACEMGRAAREKAVNEFGPEMHYEKIISVYKNLL